MVPTSAEKVNCESSPLCAKHAFIACANSKAAVQVGMSRASGTAHACSRSENCTDSTRDLLAATAVGSASLHIATLAQIAQCKRPVGRA